MNRHEHHYEVVLGSEVIHGKKMTILGKLTIVDGCGNVESFKKRCKKCKRVVKVTPQCCDFNSF